MSRKMKAMINTSKFINVNISGDEFENPEGDKVEGSEGEKNGEFM